MEQEYFLICLKANKDILSFHENKILTEKDYHPIESEEIGEYQSIVSVGSSYYDNHDCNVESEPYLDYQMRSVSFKKVNDFSLDGFWYDSKNGVVIYGYLPGIYAKKGHQGYHEVCTGKFIDWNSIYSATKMETKEDLEIMMENLNFIEKHRSAYIRLTQERLSKLEEGKENFLAAVKKYQKRRDQIKNSTKEVENSTRQVNFVWYEQEKEALEYKKRIQGLISFSKY